MERILSILFFFWTYKEFLVMTHEELLKKITDKLNEMDYSQSIFGRGEDAFCDMDEEEENEFIKSIGELVFVKRIRDGEDVQVVWRYPVDNLYFAIDGSYNSWIGSDFEGNELYPVKPVEVTYTEYHSIK